MTLLRLKTLSKKAFLWAKKFWWIIILGLLFVCAGLLSMLTKNAGLLASVLDLMDAKKDAHDQEMETLAHIHNNEIAEKNIRLKDHLEKTEEIKKRFEEKGEELDKRKEAELKKIIEEGYNNPEKLADDLAAAFGLDND